jgi:hypothetical protein
MANWVNMSAMPFKIFVMGLSHVTALVRAWHASSAAYPETRFVLLNDPAYQPPLNEAGLHPAILTQLREAGAGLHVSLLGGNDHSMIGVVRHPQRFDFVLPAEPDLPLDENVEIVPAGLLRQELSRRIAPHLEVLALYRRVVPGRVVHIESPPPLPTAHIQAYPGIFQDLVAECGVSPPLLRYKLWQLHSALYREACARLGVEFLPAPRETQDAQGIMLPHFCNPDPTHGNARYGGHVLAKLLERSP